MFNKVIDRRFFQSEAGSGQSILDEISAEVAQLTDEEIAAAATQIQARKDREKARMTPDRAQKMKDREKRRRLLNKKIMELAKAKGLVPQAQAAQAAEAAQ